MVQDVADGDYATANAVTQGCKDLARSARIAGDHAVAADRLGQALDLGTITGEQNEVDTRLQHLVDLANAGRTEDAAAALAAVDARIADVPDDANRRWYEYRTARSLYKAGMLEAARTRLQSIRADYFGEREGMKALFVLADLEERAGAPADAFGYQVEFMQSYPDQRPYVLQAAQRALDLGARYPGIVDADTMNQLIDVLVEDLPDGDWRALERAAQYLHRRGDIARADALLTRARTALDHDHALNGDEPLSRNWISSESSFVNCLFQMRRSAEIVGFVDQVGLDNLYPVLQDKAKAIGTYQILMSNVMSLEAAGRGAEHALRRGELQALVPNFPEWVRAELEAEAIGGIWFNGTFREMEPYAEDFMRRYPRHFQTAWMRLMFILALINDRNWQRALAMIAEAEIYQPPEKDPFSKRYLSNIEWLKGYCLHAMGQPEGLALMATNKAEDWIQAAAATTISKRG